MKSTIVKIGNSRGVRIPKLILEESGLGNDIELTARKGEIKIVSAKTDDNSILDTAVASEKTLAKDWSRPEEDEAWANIQVAK